MTHMEPAARIERVRELVAACYRTRPRVGAPVVELTDLEAVLDALDRARENRDHMRDLYEARSTRHDLLTLALEDLEDRWRYDGEAEVALNYCADRLRDARERFET